MDGFNCEMNCSELWDWADEDYNLRTNLVDDVSQYLCDEVNQNDCSLLSMLDLQTPIRDCTEFGYRGSETGGSPNKGLPVYRESSLQKRRRVLEFSSDNNDINFNYEQSTSSILKSKARDDLLMDDSPSQDLRCNSPWNPDFQDDRYSSGFEGVEQPPDGWLSNCFSENQMRYDAAEMNAHVPSYDQVNFSDSYTVSSEMESDAVQKNPTPARPKIYLGKKSFIRSPRKLTTSVVYPFALIKPCGAQGDVTLKDINQRILGPPPSREKNMMEDDSSSYPKSAFSGKPVVVKTKIHTEGKGSITIMRTKG